MTIGFFLELLVVILVLAALAWLYCAVFDFVDAWKKKKRVRQDAMARLLTADNPRTTELRRMTEELREGRLPPMWGRYGFTEHEPPDGPPDGWERRPALPKARRMMD